MQQFISSLRCPITQNRLHLVNESEIKQLKIQTDAFNQFQCTFGLIDSSNQYFYPIYEDIFILLSHYAIYVGENEDSRKQFSFDKQRVFDYYNQVSYLLKGQYNIYGDSAKWVDFREVSEEYIRHSFLHAKQYLPKRGEYLLDVASGPIGSPEYMSISESFTTRICVDISVNALLQAKYNMQKAKQKGIFICADITNLPIANDAVDAVLSQHTLYHVPKNEQKVAVEEMYRVAKWDSKIVIVYCWFYHSWMMNISLNIVQLYRIARHFAGKIAVKWFSKEPKLYFYAHSPKWFKRSLPFSNQLKMYCWRSTNKYFLNLYIHKALFGKQLLSKLQKIEKKYSEFMATFGEYAVLVISKQKSE